MRDHPAEQGNRREELIGGEVVMTSPAALRYNRTTLKITALSVPVAASGC